MLEYLNHNAGGVTAIFTLALLLVTGFYAWTTFDLLREARQSRLMASEPRVVAYLRVNEVHSNIVQLHVANLSGAAAMGVTASISKLTDWPNPFGLDNSKILRDLKFLRPREVLKFDLGMGPDLFQDDVPAEFQIAIAFQSLDGRAFSFSDKLRVESIDGHSHFQIYSIDDVARRLKEMTDALRSVIGSRRLRVETCHADDREAERLRWDEQRASVKAGDGSGTKES
ncbi:MULTISPECIES: hypothetical protein [unclassified Sphingopyxis]|jgi:hypothetical protein|uniref:hypothetical protein n=1 Tax=unclassified Sphingopyxis TaxID=2614943 RepID=UPI002855D206|nr:MULTISPECIES: hypothetical protein [unclassified Sphingopyxis]MDR6834245.1 hypothetical protein [Sphingopyxis sp. BE122]MDR7226514.1 hypothetical protein [Sphingopyxis sp. BE259]